MLRNAVAMTLLLLALGCARSGQVHLNGAGATFPYPLYSRWMDDYRSVSPDVALNYQSIGSGGGIRQITEQTVDFGASDAPMTDGELAAAPGPLLHVPTALGAVVVVYNLQDVPSGLRLTPDVLADILLGKIARWDDPRLRKLNPTAKLPAADITVVHRSDGSGTSAVFTEYLCRVSPEWKSQVGAGKSVNWPVGLGGKGNEGVSGQVKTTPGTLGYVELAYARQTGLACALLRNRAGHWVEPAPESITAAAAGCLKELPEDLRLVIVDAPGERSYPIASFTYILAYREQPDPARGEALARFLWWAVHDGQARCAELDYAPLPPEVVARVETRLRRMQNAGKPLLPRS
ncbi:MAG: phosphate ABC transporter substrate-binding protein PstS [Candidatus Eremiobacterota bacterium]